MRHVSTMMIFHGYVSMVLARIGQTSQTMILVVMNGRKRMSRNSSSSASGGIGFTGLLQVAFIVLKLCKVINWSWLWVLSPTWISLILAILIIVFIVWIKS